MALALPCVALKIKGLGLRLVGKKVKLGLPWIALGVARVKWVLSL